MFLRRMYGVVLGLVMFHLMMVGADLSCSDLGHASHAPANGHDAMAMSSGQGTAAAEQPCKTPAQPQCCRAMTSCAVNAAVTGAARPAHHLALRDAAVRALMLEPQSRTSSPDPPPPRA